jgi:hypothetical protein
MVYQRTSKALDVSYTRGWEKDFTGKIPDVEIALL